MIFFNSHLFYKVALKKTYTKCDTCQPNNVPSFLSCPVLSLQIQVPKLPFGGELNSSVSVLGRGTGAIWIKWKNPCSTPKCRIWVTFWLHSAASIYFTQRPCEREKKKKACHRKASILINKQSLSFSQSSFLILLFASYAEWKRSKWWKEMEGRGRGGKQNLNKPQQTHKSTANKDQLNNLKCFDRSLHHSCLIKKTLVLLKVSHTPVNATTVFSFLFLFTTTVKMNSVALNQNLFLDNSINRTSSPY